MKWRTAVEDCASKFFYLEETIQRVLNEEDDNRGMPSDKESDLDHQLYVMDDDRRQVLR